MMTAPTVKTVIFILESIRMMARTKNYIISHMIGMIFTRCFGIPVIFSNFALTSRTAELLVNLNKLPSFE